MASLEPLLGQDMGIEHLSSELLGVGLYTLPEASRLSGVPSRSIRRWLLGYKYEDRSGAGRSMPPLWEGDMPSANHTTGLSFLDLMEVRMVHAFRAHKVSWRAIREAAAVACDMYSDKHPFTMKRFQTDGNRIFAELQEQGEVRFFDLNRKHYVLKTIVERSLFEGIEFEHEQAARWFPSWAGGKIVLDPKRSFGQPILSREGVPTEILAKAAQVEESAAVVAKWYDVPIPAVKAAVAFEKRLAA